MYTDTLYVLFTMVSCLLSLVIGGGIVAALFLLSDNKRANQVVVVNKKRTEQVILPDVPYKNLNSYIGPLLRHGWHVTDKIENDIVQGFVTVIIEKEIE